MNETMGPVPANNVPDRHGDRRAEITALHIGIMCDIAANRISLDDMSEWMRDRLVELIFHEPMLIDTLGPSVVLTEAGGRFLRDALALSDNPMRTGPFSEGNGQ